MTRRSAFGAAAVIATLWASPALAQQPAGDVEAAVHLGNRVLNRGVSNTYEKGWHIGASYRITSLISVVGDAGGDYDKRSGYTANIYTYAGGARFQEAGTRMVRPFLQLLLGAGQDNDSNSGVTNHYPVLLPGGGVDLGGRCALRVRLDFPLYMTFGDVYKGARLAVGVSLGFGTRK